MVRDTPLIWATPPGQGACLLLSQSCILICFLFLPSALFFLPVYLEMLVVFPHLAETIRLLLVGQQPLLKPIQEASLCSSSLPGEVLLGLCCGALWLILCGGIAACVSLPGMAACAMCMLPAPAPSPPAPGKLCALTHAWAFPAFWPEELLMSQDTWARHGPVLTVLPTLACCSLSNARSHAPPSVNTVP